MQLPYFYEPNVSAINTVMMVSEETSKHCVQVLRMREGDRLQLTNGKGSLFTATIIKADKKHGSVRIEESFFTNREGRDICLAVSLLKNATRFEWFLEKAVEIGVSEIVPLLCERTEKQHYKESRFQSIVVSAMLQSRQIWLPVLREPTAFNDLVSETIASQKLIAHCVDDSNKTELSFLPIGQKVQMLIGPEGDFSEREISLALQQNYQPVTLGSTRLRTETAGVVASALLIQSANHQK